jgi:hypothetical protein
MPSDSLVPFDQNDGHNAKGHRQKGIFQLALWYTIITFTLVGSAFTMVFSGCLIMVFWLALYIVSSIYFGNPPPMSFGPRVNLSGLKSHSGIAESRVSYDGRVFSVANDYYCPAYFDYEDWGVCELAVTDITEIKNPASRVTITYSANTRKGEMYIYIGKKEIPYFYDKERITLCYNSPSGNVYKTTLSVDDPRVPCLFYDSKNKNRHELVELWLQLNKEKDKHEKIFDAEKARIEDDEKQKKEDEQIFRYLEQFQNGSAEQLQNLRERILSIPDGIGGYKFGTFEKAKTLDKFVQYMEKNYERLGSPEEYRVGMEKIRSCNALENETE